MSLIRGLFCSTFLVAVIIIITAPNLSSAAKCPGVKHNLIVGTRLHKDMLLSKEHIQSSWKLIGTVKKTITYPRKKEDENKYIITQIKVLDKYTNGHGGCPSIRKGGVGHSNVTVLLEGEILRGLEFDVEIYGLKRSKAKKLFKLN
uniref:Venom protein family 3 protein 1 n=1 Tax=Pristhesancus plagipennis TaxID=1955184 RepID=A0A1Q1NPD9_PRIPG|nr:venom protein family 3 protein 1 [Pristhesancus plagipennis]